MYPQRQLRVYTVHLPNGSSSISAALARATVSGADEREQSSLRIPAQDDLG
jgi:hypothetical protein